MNHRRLDCDPQMKNYYGASEMRKLLRKLPDGTFTIDRAIDKLMEYRLRKPIRQTIRKKLNAAVKMKLLSKESQKPARYQKTGK